MRIISTLLLCSIATLCVTLTSSAQDDDAETPLVESMSELNSSLRSFRKALKGEAPDKEAALTKILSMQAAIQISKLEVPEMASEMESEAGRSLTISYRKDLIETQKELLSLEALILDGDFKAADGSIRRLLQMKKAGHDKYIEDA
jgi:hypothetical protein